ncbi:MAG TPA: hypothetical protein VMW17_19700 [Candidatus Binatia bacterium]|nr:hypothetical protein [Candidatus Binatia bacterium]
MIVISSGESSLAEPTGSPTARESLALCDRSDDVPEAEKTTLLDRGLRLAERALEDDAHDGAAHFGVFCNLGKLTDLRGAGLRSLFAIRRLHRELEASLALAPDDPDVLAAKGAFLLNLPRLLGGDTVEAERSLRRALEIEPTNGTAQRYLDKARQSSRQP